MPRLEQITALILAGALAIPSYWFFWTLARGGGYVKREQPNIDLIDQQMRNELPD